MLSLKDKLSKNLEKATEEKIAEETEKLAGISDKELFSFARYDEITLTGAARSACSLKIKGRWR